jgi:hypothetical protein
MDHATFERELAKYKVTRKADHYKIRFNKVRNEVKTIKAGVRKDVIKQNKQDNSTPVPMKPASDFWDLLENIITNLDAKEKAEFMKALKEEHHVVDERINIDDLELIAASLV